MSPFSSSRYYPILCVSRPHRIDINDPHRVTGFGKSSRLLTVLWITSINEMFNNNNTFITQFKYCRIRLDKFHLSIFSSWRSFNLHPDLDSRINMTLHLPRFDNSFPIDSAKGHLHACITILAVHASLSSGTFVWHPRLYASLMNIHQLLPGVWQHLYPRSYKIFRQVRVRSKYLKS